MYQCTSYDGIERYSESYDPNPRCEPLVAVLPLPEPAHAAQALSCRWVEDSCVRLSDAEACRIWRDKHKEAISLAQRSFSDTQEYRKSELRAASARSSTRAAPSAQGGHSTQGQCRGTPARGKLRRIDRLETLAARHADAARLPGAWLPHDLMAGLVLTTMLVPVGIAYAVARRAGHLRPVRHHRAAARVRAVRPSRILVLGPGLLARRRDPRGRAAAVGRRPGARRALASLMAVVSGWCAS
jgi:hypothetical protein